MKDGVLTLFDGLNCWIGGAEMIALFMEGFFSVERAFDKVGGSLIPVVLSLTAAVEPSFRSEGQGKKRSRQEMRFSNRLCPTFTSLRVLEREI